MGQHPDGAARSVFQIGGDRRVRKVQPPVRPKAVALFRDGQGDDVHLRVHNRGNDRLRIVARQKQPVMHRDSFDVEPLRPANTKVVGPALPAQ